MNSACASEIRPRSDSPSSRDARTYGHTDRQTDRQTHRHLSFIYRQAPMPGFARGTTPGGQHPGNSLMTQIIDLQTLFAINDRQTVQKNTQTDRQVAFIGRDYSREYLKMRLMVGEAEGV